MKRVNLIFGLMFLGLVFSASNAKADGFCTDDGPKCATAGGTVAAGAAGGIYSLTAYRAADAFSKANSKELASYSTPRAVDTGTVSSLAQQVAEGDRVTVTYNLSEAANRAHHIHEMESSAESYQTLARQADLNAAAALVPKWETESYQDSQGNWQTKQVMKGPDVAAAAMYEGQAVSYRSQARQYTQQATDARAGGPVPIYDFDKVIDARAGNSKLTTEFLNDEMYKGSKIKKVALLPAAQAARWRAMVMKARGGAAVAVLGAAGAVEELTVGAAAARMQRNPDNGGYVPAYRAGR